MKIQKRKPNKLLIRCYKSSLLRKLVIKYILKFDGGDVHSSTLREIFRHYYGVTIGKYSYGGCFYPGAVDPNTTIGNYCSVANGVRIMNRNHPVDAFTMHPFFFNKKSGIVKTDTIEYHSKTIGNDVWIGNGAMLLPGVSSVGDGAVIGAGSIVTKDVPDFALVAGNPARIIKYRFTERARNYLKEEQWWECDVSELLKKKEEIQQRLNELFEKVSDINANSVR